VFLVPVGFEARFAGIDPLVPELSPTLACACTRQLAFPFISLIPVCSPVTTWISDQRVVIGAYDAEFFLPSTDFAYGQYRMSNDRRLVTRAETRSHDLDSSEWVTTVKHQVHKKKRHNTILS